MTSSTEVLRIKKLRMIYPNSDNWILNELDLCIRKGERVALIGSSGCGKSTVAKAVMQLLPAGSVCEGEINLSGQNILNFNQSSLEMMRGEKVGLVFQDPMARLNPLMTIGTHLVDTLESHKPLETKKSLRKLAEGLLQKVGIQTNRFYAYPHEMSGGMRQRVAIALAIALKPPLIIADEPTTNLDMAIANQIMVQLSELCDDNRSALLLITHDLSLAAKWSDKIYILDQGKIIESGLSEQIIDQPKSIIGKRLVNAARFLKGAQNQRDLKSEIPLLIVNSLRCWHQTSKWFWSPIWIKAVDEISFALNKGDTLGVVGLSGCGKSTLCRALMGLVPVRGGEIILFGQRLSRLNVSSVRKIRKDMQMIFQDPCACLNPTMTLGESIEDPLLIHNICNRSQAKGKVRELLSVVGLNPPESFERRLPSQISGGQQQRVAIARALALNPKILVCDESVSMLDAEIQSEILKLLKELQIQFGLAILFITHDLSVASVFCNRIIVLDQGKIVEEGPGQSIFKSPKSELTQKLVESSPFLQSTISK